MAGSNLGYGRFSLVPPGHRGQKGQNRTGPEQQNLFLPSQACFYYSHSLVVISFPSANRNTTRSSAWTVTWSTVLFQSFSSKVSGRAVSSPKEAESKNEDDDSDNHPGAGGNSGTMIVDATCAPSNIRYPQDVSRLNEARESAEKLLDVLHDPADGKKPRTYRQRARKDYLKYVRCRKHTAKMTRKAIGKQLTYLRRALNAVDGKLSLGKSLTTRQMERLDTIRTVYAQQKYMYDNRTHSVPDRIVSLSQPFVRPIVRGKAGKPVEFGAKLDISVVDGWTRLEFCSFDAYNEAGNLQEMAERFREREGHYPSRILADKIY